MDTTRSKLNEAKPAEQLAFLVTRKTHMEDLSHLREESPHEIVIPPWRKMLNVYKMTYSSLHTAIDN